MRLFIGGDFSGHIGASEDGYGLTHRSFGYVERNEGGTTILDRAIAYGLMVANSYFKKKEEHLVTFKSGNAKTH